MRAVMATHPDDRHDRRVPRVAAGRPHPGFSSLLRPICDEAGNRTGLRGTVKDVTEVRRAEVDLRRSEERFRQGFDNAPIAMTLVDPASMRYLRVNDAFCTMVGRTREALVRAVLRRDQPPRRLPASPRACRGS